jgi:hypothetical protein
LIVGFAVLKSGIKPTACAELEDGLGQACAAGRTGHILYKGSELRIDGAPAMIDRRSVPR